MAWNQPTYSKKKQPRKGGRGALYSILAVVAVCCAVGVWMLMRGKDAPGADNDAPARRGGKIAEAKPRAAHNSVPATAAKPTVAKEEKPKPLPPQRVGELRDGYRLLPDGTMHRVLGIITNTPPKFSLADKTFTHSADVELGNLLMVEPGDDLLGSAEGMYRGFSKELDEALAEPIVYDKDDTDLQRELKDGVNELRAELKARRDVGENIEKVMEDTWNQLKELSLYRQELEDQVRQLSTDDLTQKDYEDLLAAANQMLSDRGIKPLEMPATLKHTLRLRQIQERAAEKAKEGKSNEK